MPSRTQLLASACLLVCSLPACAEFENGGLASTKPVGTRPNQPTFGTVVASVRPSRRTDELADLRHLAAFQFVVVRRALVFPAPPGPQLPPSTIKNPSNIPRQRR
jgi:hypothetical protein